MKPARLTVMSMYLVRMLTGGRVESMDTVIAERIGVDNHLGMPQHSVSYRGLAVVLLVTALEWWRYRHGNLLESLLALAVVVFAFFLFTLFRFRIHRLALLTTVEAQTALLRSISSLTLRITGAAVILSFLFFLSRK
jgi:putative effector of murein hydrolase